MKTKKTLLGIAAALALSVCVAGQDVAQSGFVISLKNGSTIRGRTLSRDNSTGKLRLSMTETGSGEPRSYAIISPEDASITISLRGGSQIRCKEFALNGDTVAVKLGSASRVEVQWAEIESISFAP
jgi:hypothetical protein